jgi:hypothetical protein
LESFSSVSVNVPKIAQDVSLKPRRADSNLIITRNFEDSPFPQAIPVYQEVVHSNLKVSSAVSRPIAGDQGEKSLEDRLLNQIGKNTFILQLLPPKQPAPSMEEGKIQIQIIKILHQIQMYIGIFTSIIPLQMFIYHQDIQHGLFQLSNKYCKHRYRPQSIHPYDSN